jgi:hypothetical protein
MLSTDRVLRAIGQPDFETQTLVWLDRRVDRERLERGLARFARRHPLIGARLDDARAAAPFWRVPAEARATLREKNLETADEAAVHDCAARLLATPPDPAEADPLRFHLLHLPDGRDVFLMQYTHVLTDNNAALRIVREIDRLANAAAGELDQPQADAGTSSADVDPVAEYLGRHSRWRRLRAALRVLDLRFRSYRGGAVTLTGQKPPAAPPQRSGPIAFSMSARTLSADDTARLATRSAEICGLPNVSMALLAATFRAIGRHTCEPASRGRSLFAGIGVNLGPATAQTLKFQNLMSIVPLRAGWQDLDDYESLVRMLREQFRERLERSADLGLVELARFVSTRPRLADASVRRVMLGGYSLWYAYFGSLDAAGTEFCGTNIDNVYFTAPTWPPMGLTLLGTQFRGRLRLQSISLPDLVPATTTEAVLEMITGDLTEPQAITATETRA